MLKMLNKNRNNHLTTQNMFVSKNKSCIIKIKYTAVLKMLNKNILNHLTF
jgi:hypothetical protein